MKHQQCHISFPIKEVAAVKNFYTKIFQCPTQDIDEHSFAVDFYGNNLVFTVTKEFTPMKPPVVELEIKEYPNFPAIPLFHFGAILNLEEFKEFEDNLLAHSSEVNFIVKPMVTNAGQDNEHHMTFFYDPSGYPIEMKGLKNYSLEKIKRWSHYKDHQ